MRTSATTPRSGRGGFTVIELLVAVAIVIFLVGVLTMGLIGVKDKAQRKASQALIEQIKVAMQSYHADFRDYPPDGYDTEQGWTYNAQGVLVGTPPRAVKGTASLIYFLCRPLNKVSVVGTPEVDSSGRVDERFIQRQKVGPYLVDLKSSYYSREGFNPVGNRWENPSWNTDVRTEIVDAWGRPLCYDKVKVDTDVYFQPARFHNSGSTSAVPRGSGMGVHLHLELFTEGLVLITDDMENADTWPGIESMDANARYQKHMDPRFIDPDTIPDPTGSWTGTRSTHEPKNIGHYDIWSYGRSYMHAGDDITSWGE